MELNLQLLLIMLQSLFSIDFIRCIRCNFIKWVPWNHKQCIIPWQLCSIWKQVLLTHFCVIQNWTRRKRLAPSPLRKFGQELTVLNLAALSNSKKVQSISEKVQNVFYMHAHIHVYICTFSFLAIVTHDNWKLGTFPYSRSGIVPTLYIEGVKSFSISPIQFIMQRLHKLPHVCC